MSFVGKKEIAIKLRTQGFSFGYIGEKIKVSKSTVSSWCKDIILTDTQKKHLKQNIISAGRKGRMIGVLANKNKKKEAIKKANVLAKEFIKQINDRELTLIAIALYWSEGAKTQNTSGFQFVNSDPSMIVLMKKFLLQNGVLKEELTCSIQINESHKSRIKEVLKFWQNLLDLQHGQFRKPYFIKSISKKIYDNHDNYFGICRLIVQKSSGLKYKMLGLIQALKESSLSE